MSPWFKNVIVVSNTGGKRSGPLHPLSLKMVNAVHTVDFHCAKRPDVLEPLCLIKEAFGVDAVYTADIHSAKSMAVLHSLSLKKAESVVDASNTEDIHCAKSLVVLPMSLLC
jgi:uridylate kinase